MSEPIITSAEAIAENTGAMVAGLKAIGESMKTNNAPEQTPAEAAKVSESAEAEAARIAAEKEAALAKSRAARAAAIDARVKELMACEGKSFKPKDPLVSGPVIVNKYMGIHVIPARNRAEYLFNIECRGHYNCNVSATDFLEAHTLIETPASIQSEPLPH